MSIELAAMIVPPSVFDSIESDLRAAVSTNTLASTVLVVAVLDSRFMNGTVSGLSPGCFVQKEKFIFL
jgi:hypothetical protein